MSKNLPRDGFEMSNQVDANEIKKFKPKIITKGYYVNSNITESESIEVEDIYERLAGEKNSKFYLKMKVKDQKLFDQTLVSYEKI